MRKSVIFGLSSGSVNMNVIVRVKTRVQLYSNSQNDHKQGQKRFLCPKIFPLIIVLTQFYRHFETEKVILDHPETSYLVQLDDTRWRFSKVNLMLTKLCNLIDVFICTRLNPSLKILPLVQNVAAGMWLI